MRDVFTTVLRYKLWFDLWGARQRTIQAVLTIAIGAFAVGTILGSLRGVQTDTRNTWHSVAAPAIMLRVSPSAPAALVESLRNRADLAAVEGQMEQSIKWRRTPNDTWQPATLVARDNYADQRLNLLLLEDGAWPAGSTVAVERRFSMAPGEAIQLEVGDHDVHAVIGGTVYNRSTMSASLGGSLIVYTSREHFAKLTGSDNFQVLMATVADYSPEAATLAARRLEADLADQGFSAVFGTYNRAQVVNPQQAWFEELIAGIGLVMQIVAVIAMALSLLLIYSTVTAIIAQQTSQIGELKAIGASSSQIISIYMLLVGAYGAMAALISLPAALISSNVLRIVLITRLGMDPGPLRFDLAPLLVQLALCLIAPLLIALVPILHGSRITVREAISSYGLSSTGSRLDTVLSTATWLSRILSLAISNVFRNWSRLLLTQLALGGAGITLVAVLSTQATLNYTSGTLMSDIYRYQVQLDTKRLATLNQLDRGAEAPDATNIEAWRTQSVVLELANGRQQTIQLNGLPIPSAAYQPHLSAGRWLQPNDSYALVLTESVANELALHVGDSVTMRIPGSGSTKIWASERSWTVVGIVLEPYLRNLSRIGMVSRDTLLDELGNGLRANRVQIQAPTANGTNAPVVASTLRAFYGDRGMEMGTTMTDTVAERSRMESSNLAVVTMLLLAMAVIVAAVGGIALSGVLQISVLERRREIGVLRAIGATPHTVRTLVVGEGLILGWLSCLIALAFSYPAGLALSRMLAGTLGISIIYQYSWAAVALWVVLASVIGIVASLAPAQRAISQSVQESLSYE